MASLESTQGGGPHFVDLRDLDFPRVPLQRCGTQGTPYLKWVRVGMPKINQEVIRSVFFLYDTVEDARAGVNSRGTGFIVAADYGISFYGVTNRHVAGAAGGSVVRLNTVDGVEVFDFGPEDWEIHPGGDDIAVIPLPIDHAKHHVSAIPVQMFAPKNNYDLGVGDDVFMVGLFADHEGREKNNPLARFGNISMLASDESKILWESKLVERHIVDMHSRSGFSGSPVFVYRTFGSDLDAGSVKVGIDPRPFTQRGRDADFRAITGDPVRTTIFHDTLFKFLGIHCSQFREQWKLKELGVISEARYEITDETYISGVSGMTCVAPAWKILEVLNLPKFVAQREAAHAALVKHSGNRTQPEDESRRPV